MNSFLFICTANMLRSPTAEHVARLHGFSADSAGTMVGAVRELTREAIERAEHVVCISQRHAMEVREFMPDAPNLIVWDIPDDYDYCQPELIALIEAKLKAFKPSHPYPTRT